MGLWYRIIARGAVGPSASPRTAKGPTPHRIQPRFRDSHPEPGADFASYGRHHTCSRGNRPAFSKCFRRDFVTVCGVTLGDLAGALREVGGLSSTFRHGMITTLRPSPAIRPVGPSFAGMADECAPDVWGRARCAAGYFLNSLVYGGVWWTFGWCSRASPGSRDAECPWNPSWRSRLLSTHLLSLLGGQCGVKSWGLRCFHPLLNVHPVRIKHRRNADETSLPARPRGGPSMPACRVRGNSSTLAAPRRIRAAFSPCRLAEGRPISGKRAACPSSV